MATSFTSLALDTQRHPDAMKLVTAEEGGLSA